MAEDIHRKSMKALEISVDGDLVTLDEYKNETMPSTYIPKSRYLRRNKNVFYIAGGSLLLILLIANLIVVSFKKSSAANSIEKSKTELPFNSSNFDLSSQSTTLQLFSSSSTTSPLYTDQPIDLSRALIMTSGRNLWAVDTSSWKCQILRQTKRNIVAFDINENESILWIEQNSSVVSRLHYNASLSYFPKLEPQAMAVDYITNKLYVIDKEAGTLNVVDAVGNQSGVVISDLRNPYDIVLDPLMGVVFITQLHNSLLRCDMDGSSLLEIAKNSKISTVTINRTNKRIYWLTDSKIIETSDYEGDNRLIFYKFEHSNDHIVNLMFHDNQLFWLSMSFQSNKTIVYSCSTNGIYCEDLIKRSVPFVTQNIRAAPDKINTPNVNPCSMNNGNCEQFCLLSTTGHTCACKIGWQLNTNGKTCSPVTKFLIYSQGTYFRGRILDTIRQTFVDAFSPTRFTVLSLKKKNRIDFDRGWTFGEVYFADDLCIYRLNLTDGTQTKVYHIMDFKHYHIHGLILDRRSDNFYLYKKSNNDDDGSIVMMTKKERILEKTLISFKNADVPKSYAVCSDYLFYNLEEKNVKFHQLAFANESLYDWSLVGPNIIPTVFALDQNENRIYFIDRSNSSHVDITSNLIERGSRYWYWLKFSGRSITTFSVHQRWFYIGDKANIWRFDKKNGKDMINVVSTHEWNSDIEIFGGQVFDLTVLNDDRKSACMIGNGGCEQFCFQRKIMSCGCRDGMHIDQDLYCK